MDSKIVLVAPLNWGLGHATRVIPLIDSLYKHHFSVIIAADGKALQLLKQEFPETPCFRLPDIEVYYSKKHVFLKIFLQIPKIFIKSIVEHFKLKKIVKKYPVDMIISDNRYGVWNKKTYNIFISHQLKLRLPKSISFLSFIYPLMLKLSLKPYDECWVPDLEPGKDFSGGLSHHLSGFSSVKYVGVLSRFNRYLNGKAMGKKYDVLVILSGPEPQRTIFENIIFQQADDKNIKVAIVRGVEQREEIKRSTDVFGMVHSEPLFHLIKQSGIVVCRAGYSSIMDLYVAGAQAVLVPTPGQTEQEYLAAYLKQKGYFYSATQQNFNLDNALTEAKNYAPPRYEQKDNERLEKEVSNLKLKLP
ncbi:MAG: glycosyltransferase [Bacteroidales bacterium]